VAAFRRTIARPRASTSSPPDRASISPDAGRRVAILSVAGEARTCSRYRAAHFEGELTALRSYRPWWRRLIALAALAPWSPNAPASLTISSVSRIWLRNSIMGVGAHRDHCGEDQCRNMRHCRLRRFELRCAKGPGPLGAPLDEGACERQAIQPPQRRLFSWEAQGSALACANPNLCDFSKRRIFTLHIEVRIRYAQPRSRSLRVTIR